jgi:hypothetical protein
MLGCFGPIESALYEMFREYERDYFDQLRADDDGMAQP